MQKYYTIAYTALHEFSPSASVIYVHLCNFQVRQMEVGALVTIRGIGRVNLANLTQVSMQIIFLVFSSFQIIFCIWIIVIWMDL